MPPYQPARAVALVRAHRIHINDVPALFSEGAEPEPARADLPPHLARLGQKLQGLWQSCVKNLTPPQAGNEKAVRAAQMRRQTQAGA